MKVDILPLLGVGAILYAFYSQNSDNSFSSVGSFSSFSSGFKTIDEAQTQEIPQTAKSQPSINYNIVVESPKLPTLKPLSDVRTSKKVEEQPIIKPKPTTSVVKTKKATYKVSEEYEKGIYEVSEINGIKFDTKKPIVSTTEQGDFIIGYHDYEKQQSITIPDKKVPENISIEPERLLSPIELPTKKKEEQPKFDISNIFESANPLFTSLTKLW